MDFRDKLVKLAYDKVELRPHLLPLLKEASKGGETFIKLLEDAGILASTLDIQNPTRILSHIAKYLSDGGFFEAFETGPLSYSDLKVVSYTPLQGYNDVEIDWQAKLMLSWDTATELILYPILLRYSRASVKVLAGNKAFRDLVSKEIRIRSGAETRLYDSFTSHLERNSDFESGADIGPYGSGVELDHYSQGFEGKWGSQGLLITLQGETRI